MSYLVAMALPAASLMTKLDTQRITDAVARMLVREQSNGVLREFRLKGRRRADLIALNKDGHIAIVEIKSSPQDFLRDKKWTEYIEWADKFYFGVGKDFPLEILPEAERSGIIITDGYECHEVQPAPFKRINGLRRSRLVREIAKVSMRRIEYSRNGLLKKLNSVSLDLSKHPNFK
tara:strand:- start:193 stop:720 length:528 start_codon:yes stop_codon:yes gene_type:complete